MKEAKNKKVRESKGVTATDSDINDTFSSKKHEDCTSNQPTDSLHNVKEELRNVIELMGPSTPHLTLNSSSDADNEDSYISTSIYSSVLQVKRVTLTDECTTIPPSSDTPRDMSQMSLLPADSTYSDKELCFVEEERNVPVSIVEQPHHKNCPCRRYAKSLQDMAASGAFNIFRPNDSYTLLPKQEQSEPKTTSKTKSFNLLSLFKFRRTYKEGSKEPMDLYKINILQTNDEHSPPRRLVFDLIDDIPRPETNTVATNTSLRESSKSKACDSCPRMSGLPGVPTAFHSYISSPKHSTEHAQKHGSSKNPKRNIADPTKIDVYYFDHGNSSYFRTTDYPPALVTEVIAEKTEAYTSKFWAEFFGTIHIGFAFFTSFILQLLRFLLQSLIRPLTVGLTQLTSDYFFKPCLAVIFNAVIQPPLIFLYNIATSLRDLADPLAEALGYFLKEIANICRAIRIVEIKQDKHTPVKGPHIKKKLKLKCNNECV